VPVSVADPDANIADPYRRLSASQMVTWHACPRLWYYNNILKLRGPLPPQIIRGNAAESCISRVMRDSPSLVSKYADDILKSPILDDGKPAYEYDELWPSPSIQALDESEWPKDRTSLEEWAMARVDTHFDKCWNDAVREWESLTNRTGESNQADMTECRKMVENGIKLHIDQVELCLNNLNSVILDSWRKGENRPKWPAPDGFPLLWTQPHPCAGPVGSNVTWVESWEIARPWFVDPDADSFTQTTSHPEGWFHGEYDLVYRWTGRPSVIDIKASQGKGDRSGGYIEQLRLYAWLWWETHGRVEELEHIGIWYLGTGTIKEVEKPTLKELEEYSGELKGVYSKVHASRPSIVDCPTNPSPLRYFESGGIPANPPVDSDPLARCRNCDLRGVCENGNHELDLPSDTRIERFGHSWPITSISDIKTRVDAIGVVSNLKGPSLEEKGGVELSFRLQDGYDRAKVRTSRYGYPTNVTRSISNSTRVKVGGAIPSVWRGEVVLDIDEQSSVIIARDEETYPIVEIETRVNVIGRIWSVNAFPDGQGISRWSITILDSSGAAGVIAFKQFIPVLAAGLSRGDEIAILNGEVGEFNGVPQVKIGPNTRVVSVRTSEDVPEF
tara:strand:+ start:689 stop:2533 length:1845 start_codon:yes stop_codon:yes gene_type:complete